MSTEYLSFHHLSKTFQKDPVFERYQLPLWNEAIFLGFLGPSGAGKTTTIKILIGQLRPSSGEAYVLWKALSGHRRIHLRADRYCHG
mgnify:CR=1 FL=1